MNQERDAGATPYSLSYGENDVAAKLGAGRKSQRGIGRQRSERPSLGADAAGEH